MAAIKHVQFVLFTFVTIQTNTNQYAPNVNINTLLVLVKNDSDKRR